MSNLIKTENWDGFEISTADVIETLKLTTIEMLAHKGEYVKETLHVSDDYNFVLTTKDNLFLMRHFYGDFDYPIVPNYIEPVESILLSPDKNYVEAFNKMVFELIKSKQNPFLPSQASLQTSNNIIKKLIDLVGHPNEEPTINKEEKTFEEEKTPEKEIGFVYFLKADNGLIKIGKTKNLKSRLDCFEVKLPYELELVAFIKSENYHNLERYLHRKFKSKKVRGEWFNLTKYDIESLSNEFEIKILI